MAAGDTYTAGSTGGAANHTLTVNEMPSHSHTFTGSAVNTGNNSVGHTHKYTDYYATTTGSTAITVANLASHSHALHGYSSGRYTGSSIDSGSGQGRGSCHDGNWGSDMSNGYIVGTYGVGSGTGHTHSGANTSSTRTSNGISANHTHSVTAKGSNSNTGGGAAFSIMPPYLTVYMWKRTA